MTTKPNYPRPEYDELEPMIRLSGVITASWRFCGNSRESNLIRQWCKELNISIPAPKPKLQTLTCTALLTFLNQEGQVRSTATILSVTDETIRRWMKKYKIRRSYDQASKSSRFKQFSKSTSSR